MSAKRIAIIGGGFSGACLAGVLMRAGRRVSVIEPGARLGAGLAYGTEDEAHLLNVRASNMSFYADDAEHFARWLRKRTGAGGDSFAPRKLYRAYVGETLRKASGLFGRRLEHVRAEAIACAREGEKWRITLANGRTLEADVVILALGTPPPPAHFEGLIDAWDQAALKRIPPGDVILLGSGLTAIDAALTLSAQRRSGALTMLSRRGLTPRAHLDPPRPRPTDAPDLPHDLSAALYAFRAALAKGEPWQMAMDRLRPHTAARWRAFSLAAQARFLRHLRPWWDVHRHRMAPQIAARIAELKQSGRLKVLAGEARSLEPRGKHLALHYRPRGGMASLTLEAAAIVNCTGGDADLARSASPLLQRLLQDGIVRPHETRIGFALDADDRALDADGDAHETLFVLGPLSQGAFWESTSVPDIRVHAAKIAALLC